MGTNDNIIAFLHFNQENIEKIKTLNGCEWHQKEKFWSIPYSQSNLNKLIFMFKKENLIVDYDLYLKRLREELILRNYSRKTIKTYLQFNMDFLKL